MVVSFGSSTVAGPELECSVIRPSPLHERDRTVLDLIYHHPVVHDVAWQRCLDARGTHRQDREES
jgi:hypothetical protein